MRGVSRAGGPDRVDEKIVKMLLDISDEFFDARRDAERLDVGRGIVDDAAMARPDRAHHVLFEERNSLREPERVSLRSVAVSGHRLRA